MMHHQSVNVVFWLTISLLLSGCTSQGGRQLIGNAVGNAADTEVRYSVADCKILQQRCVQGDYQEWQTSDKQLGCSCKKL